MILKYLLPVLFILSVFIQLQCSLPEVDDIVPPVVTIIYPYAGSVISGTTNFLVESTDDERVDKVWLYIDDQLVATQNGRTGNFSIDVLPFADDQQHMILAAAEDKSGNRGFSLQVLLTISDSPDLVPPSVSIVNPQTGQQVQDTVNVLASASDDRIINNVAFFVNGDSVFNDNVYPYSYRWVTTGLADSTSHSIIAKAFDQAGNWTISLPVSVTVFPRGDRTAPVLTLLYPAAGSVISGNVEVNVDASDNVGVTSMEFYVNGSLVDTDTTSASWGFTWNTTTLPAGIHSLYVKGYDAAGNVGVIPNTTFTISDNPDVTAPTLSLLNPAAGAQVSGTVNVVIDAIDDVGVTQVDFFIDGSLVSTDNSEPWEYSWNTASFSAGQHVLFAKGYDAAGNIGTLASTPVEVLDQSDLIPPTLTLLYPASGAFLSGNVTISIDATDNIGVTSVEFYIDGNLVSTDNSAPWEYNWNTAGYSPGTHVLFARGYDAAGNFGTIVNTNVQVVDPSDTTPPTLTLLYPFVGSTITGTVNVVVDATDNVGVDSVQFFVDGILTITDTNEPWGFPWNTAPYDSGSTHTLFMKGFDPSGNVGTAGPSNFIITN